MKKLDLQMFAQPVSGKKIVYLFRVLESAATDDAVAMAFTTENSNTISKDADSTVTKDGTIRTPGGAEIEITATALLISPVRTIKETSTEHQYHICP